MLVKQIPALQATWDYQIDRDNSIHTNIFPISLSLQTSVGKPETVVTPPSHSVIGLPGPCQVLQEKKSSSVTDHSFLLASQQTFISRTTWTAAYTDQSEENAYPQIAVLALLMSSCLSFLENYLVSQDDEAKLPPSTYQTILHVKE